MKIVRLSRFYYIKFTRLKGDPKSLAVGTALGVLVGITPTMPFHTILILAITFATRSSAIAAIISSWLVCNPFTYIPIYYFSMVIGNIITPYELSWKRVQALMQTLQTHDSFSHTFREILNLGFEAAIVMILGGIILALPFAIASYYISLHLFMKIREKRKAKTQNN